MTKSLYEIYSEAKRLREDMGFKGLSNSFGVLSEAAKLYPAYLRSVAGKLS